MGVKYWKNPTIHPFGHQPNKKIFNCQNFLKYFYKKDEPHRNRTRLPTLPAEPGTTGPDISSWQKWKFPKYNGKIQHYLFFGCFSKQGGRLPPTPDKKRRWTWFWKTIQNGFWCFAHKHTHTKSIYTKPIYLCFGTWVQRYLIWTCDRPRNVFIIYKILFSGWLNEM